MKKSKDSPNKPGITFINVTADNVSEAGIYCIKDKKAPGYEAKIKWFKDKINKGLKIKIASESAGKQLGFIEYIPSELAWRPVKAKNYLFIHCIAMFGKSSRGKKIASSLVKECINDAADSGKSGVCVMTSDGPWIANKTLFEKNGFIIACSRGRFELMYLSFGDKSPKPELYDWTAQSSRMKGWNLVYSDQCPWHFGSVTALTQSAAKNGIRLNVTRITTPQQAKNAPSGFGTYSLIKDGVVLEDHYLSKTRFENILKEAERKA